MKRLIIATLALVVVIAIGWMAGLPSALEVKLDQSIPEPPVDNANLRANNEHKEVFRRAFWREPAAEDRILHAERREWVSDENGVSRWQWFLAVQPGAAFSAWLRDTNPFNLVKVDPASFKADGSSPSWFPRAHELARCEIQQAAGQGMTLILDSAKNLLYSTDAGHGFAVGKKGALPAEHAPFRDADSRFPDHRHDR